MGPVALTDGSGTALLGGLSLNTVVYQKQPWPGAGYTLYQALAVAPDRFYVLWFYCKGASLSYV